MIHIFSFFFFLGHKSSRCDPRIIVVIYLFQGWWLSLTQASLSSFSSLSSITTTMLGLATWILFIHSNLSWAKSSDRLHFISIVTTSINVLFSLHLPLGGPLTTKKNISSPPPLLAYAGHVRTILNEFLLFYHLIMPLNASRSPDFVIYLS